MDRTINNCKKLIEDGKTLMADLKRSREKIKRANDFKITGKIGLNFFGNQIRGYKVNMINKNLDRAQEKILKFDSDVMRLQENLAGRIDLPHKLTEFKDANNKLKDINLRIQMRKKQLEVEKAIKSVKTVVKKLIFLKNKLEYENRKLKELENMK